MATVTVVIPVLNDAAMLSRCLAALAEQTRKPDTIVVVDNGCVDRSVLIARRAGAVVVTEPRRGILPATARGFDEADSDIIARIDADSRPRPDWLQRVVEHFESSPGLGAATGTGDFYDGPRWVRWLGRHLYLGGYFLWMGLLLGHSPLYGSNFAVRSEVWDRIRETVHRSDPRLHDDLEISFHLPTDVVVRFDPDLTMPVSARPFDTIGQTGRRVSWGFRTIWVNVREQNLWRRRKAVVAVHGLRRAAGRWAVPVSDGVDRLEVPKQIGGELVRGRFARTVARPVERETGADAPREITVPGDRPEITGADGDQDRSASRPELDGQVRCRGHQPHDVADAAQPGVAQPRPHEGLPPRTDAGGVPSDASEHHRRGGAWSGPAGDPPDAFDAAEGLTGLRRSAQ
jgi:hypothetical protein